MNDGRLTDRAEDVISHRTKGMVNDCYCHVGPKCGPMCSQNVTLNTDVVVLHASFTRPDAL